MPIDERVETWVFDFADVVATKALKRLRLEEIGVEKPFIEMIRKAIHEAVLAALHERTTDPDVD